MATIKVKPSSNAPLFLGEEGMAGHYIDCSANPYDLRPAADLIIQAAGRRRAELPPGTPLVILIGEKHPCSAHGELLHMVAQKWTSAGQRFCMGYELDSNNLVQVMTTNMGDLGHLDSDDILALDTDGAAGLLSYMTQCVVANDAPETQLNLMAFCHENKIPSIFNDAARDFAGQGEMYLDMQNRFNAAVAPACGVTKKNGIHMYGVGGIGIRHQNMAQRGVAFAASHGVDMILQNTGRSHVLGRKYDNFDTRVLSLTEAYQAAGAVVVPVFITTQGYDGGIDTIPQDRRTHLKDGVVINGLADDEFLADNDNAGAERAFIEKLHRESGCLTQSFDAERHMERNIEAIRNHCDRILTQYHANTLRRNVSLTA
ncbi:hypothetical protein [Micavibrio aeruginosavorus]|uniref:hypothetical protein n=1 Tax=Micavibrio aeruginosavorus TaxID=349221 RepID=UPI003F4AEF18